MRSLLLAGALLALTAPLVAAQATPRAGAAPGQAADRLDGLLGGVALGGDRGPVHIDADRMEFDYRTRVLTYRGTVNVTQADMTLRSDVLTVSLDSEKIERPKEVIAEGNVLITKGERKASGGKAVFDNVARTVTLSEHARLQDGPNEVAGERVVVFLDEERSVVEGGKERVRAVLVPKEGDDALAGAGGGDEP